MLSSLLHWHGPSTHSFSPISVPDGCKAQWFHVPLGSSPTSLFQDSPPQRDTPPSPMLAMWSLSFSSHLFTLVYLVFDAGADPTCYITVCRAHSAGEWLTAHACLLFFLLGAWFRRRMFITWPKEFHPPLENCVGENLNGQRVMASGLQPNVWSCFKKPLHSPFIVYGKLSTLLWSLALSKGSGDK